MRIILQRPYSGIHREPMPKRGHCFDNSSACLYNNICYNYTYPLLFVKVDYLFLLLYNHILPRRSVKVDLSPLYVIVITQVVSSVNQTKVDNNGAVSSDYNTLYYKVHLTGRQTQKSYQQFTIYFYKKILYTYIKSSYVSVSDSQLKSLGDNKLARMSK